MFRSNKLQRSHAVRFLLVGLSTWGVVAYFTNGPDYFLASNVLLASLATAVMVAYARAAFDAVMAPHLTRAHLLALGIFLAWGGTAVLRMISILIYGLDWKWMAGTDLSTFAVQLQLMAGVLHLMAPEVSPAGVLPVREWVRLGIYSGVAVLGALALFLARLF